MGSSSERNRYARANLSKEDLDPRVIAWLAMQQADIARGHINIPTAKRLLILFNQQRIELSENLQTEVERTLAAYFSLHIDYKGKNYPSPALNELIRLIEYEDKFSVNALIAVRDYRKLIKTPTSNARLISFVKSEQQRDFSLSLSRFLDISRASVIWVKSIDAISNRVNETIRIKQLSSEGWEQHPVFGEMTHAEYATELSRRRDLTFEAIEEQLAPKLEDFEKESIPDLFTMFLRFPSTAMLYQRSYFNQDAFTQSHIAQSGGRFPPFEALLIRAQETEYNL